MSTYETRHKTATKHYHIVVSIMDALKGDKECYDANLLRGFSAHKGDDYAHKVVYFAMNA